MACDSNRDNSMDGEVGPFSSKPCLGRHSAIMQFLKTRLNRPSVNGFCLGLPDFSQRRAHDKASASEHNKMSWSVIKRISSVLRLQTVSCLTQEAAVTSNETKETMPKQTAFLSMEEEVRKFIAAETGKDRLRRAWYQNRYSEESAPEDANLVVGVGQQIFFYAFLFAFFKSGFEEAKRYHIRSRTKLFGSASLANRRFAGVVIAYGMKNGLKLGIFGVSLACPLIAIWRAVSIYYNTSSPWTFALATGTVVSIWKSSLGIRGAVGGFIIGNIFGGVFGLPIQWRLRKAGMTQEDINFHQVEEIVRTKREYRKHAVAVVDEEDENEKVD